MAKKLFEVNLEYTIYVMAESGLEAQEIAERNIRDETPDHADYYFADKKTVPAAWVDSIPYGGDDDETVGQILGIK